MIDLHALDDILELDEDEERFLETYIDSLLADFVESSEGQTLSTQIEGIGYWIGSFIRYGFLYEGYTLPTLDTEEVQEIMEELLPRKVSLLEPKDADEGLLELASFWTYLQREHELSNAESILAYLRSLPVETFREYMFDPARAGMAKSFFMSGSSAGFDMSTQDGIDEYISIYNAARMLDLAAPDPDAATKSFTGQTKQKKRKKMAKASRRANRKPKKKKRK